MKLQSLTKFAMSAAITTALGGSMLMSVPRAYADADDHRECQEKVERAEAKLDKAVRKHGERSHQAQEQREHLRDARQDCWNRYHGWWEGHEKRWHTDRDWDDRHDHDDKDRDHDRDDHH